MRHDILRVMGVLLLLATAARADVLHVPAEFATLADAVGAAQPGDQIVLAAGDYVGPFEVESKDDLVIRGQGLVRLTGGTDSVPTLLVVACDNVTIDHLSFPATEGQAVHLTKSTHLVARRLRIEDAAEEGIFMDVTSDSVIERCRVEGLGKRGIVVGESVGALVTRCVVTGSTDTGIDLTDGTVCTVERCRVTDVAGTGLGLGALLGAEGCIARKNVVLDCGENGLVVGGANNLVLQNRVQDPDADGITVLAGTLGGTVQDNKVLGGQFGMKVFGASLLVTGNRIVKPAIDGVQVLADFNVVADNRVLQAAQLGINLTSDVDVGTVMDNKALKCGIDGFRGDGSEVLFSGNTAVGAAEVGFRLGGNFNTLTGNSAHGSGEFDLNDNGSGNHFFENDFGTVAP